MMKKAKTMSNIKNVIVERGKLDVEVSNNGTITMGSDGVKLYRLLIIKAGMEFEMKTGMRLTGKAPSSFTIVRKEFGLKGNKQKLYSQFCEIHGFKQFE